MPMAELSGCLLPVKPELLKTGQMPGLLGTLPIIQQQSGLVLTEPVIHWVLTKQEQSWEVLSGAII
jgi:hypothetical protein